MITVDSLIDDCTKRCYMTGLHPAALRMSDNFIKELYDQICSCPFISTTEMNYQKFYDDFCNHRLEYMGLRSCHMNCEGVAVVGIEMTYESCCGS